MGSEMNARKQKEQVNGGVDGRVEYHRGYRAKNRDEINAKRRLRYRTDEGYRKRERERVKRATKPWSELTDEEKERKRKWQREYQKRRYRTDSEFRKKQLERSRKKGKGFMAFGGFRE